MSPTWQQICCGKHFAAPRLPNRSMPNHELERAEKESEIFQDGGQIKREKDMYHHGPKHIPIICHLPDPPSFSLPTTFNNKLDSR
jgi:hypothetical protein